MMGMANDFPAAYAKRAMGEWKRRQSANLADKPMQGPKTEMQMMRDEIAALRDKINSDGMARALSEHERTR